MAHYIILAQSEVTACALGAWLELLGEIDLKPDDPRRIVWNREAYSGGGESGVLAYEALAKKIEIAARGNEDKIPLNEVIVLVDAIRPSGLSVIAEGSEWDNLVAMLILTFPEIHWVFGVVSGKLKKTRKSKADTALPDAIFPDNYLSTLLSCPRRDPLLDSLGLREWVKNITISELNENNLTDNEGKERIKHNLPCRLLKAAAIDEEKCFAYFHGYTAFRYGYRTDAVTSWSLMSKLFIPIDDKDNTEHGFDLLLEDMSLNFPDKPIATHLLDLETERAVKCRKLDSTKREMENSSNRILITTGQNLGKPGTLDANKEYLRKKAVGQWAILLKPVGGMLDLWRKAHLFKNAKGFVWPPQHPRGKNRDQEPGHGAPGKLMLIAETLLSRATTLLPKAQTVQDYIQGAVLATEAAELLSGMTPTLTLQALLLKHEFEARAECAFVGVGYHFDVKTRAKEIEQEVKAVSRWFAKDKQRESELHSLVTIMNRLAKVFREAGRFEEEHECMVRMRRWHRQLVRSKTTNPYLWVINGLLWYAEFLLASFPVFILAILLWLGGSALVWWFFDDGWKAAISGVFSSFFSGTAAIKESSWSLIGVSCVVVASGFFHLGVLVAYIYSLISRR